MKSSPARIKLLSHINRSIKALYTHDVQADREQGSPEPEVTAIVRVLAYCMTFVRIAVAHGIVDSDFDTIFKLACEHETEGWQAHRKQCEKCGGH